MHAIATRLRDRHQKQIRAIIETGLDLLSVKEKLEHGQFIDRIERAFDWDERAAQRYMSAAEVFRRRPTGFRGYRFAGIGARGAGASSYAHQCQALCAAHISQLQERRPVKCRTPTTRVPCRSPR